MSRPTTLRGAMLRALVSPLAFLAAASAGLGLIEVLDIVPSLTYVAPAPAEPGDLEDVRAERLLERHDCWTGEAPADVEIPGGVVMTLVGGGVRYYGADHRVGQALDHLFAEADPRIATVVGFCR